MLLLAGGFVLPEVLELEVHLLDLLPKLDDRLLGIEDDSLVLCKKIFLPLDHLLVSVEG